MDDVHEARDNVAKLLRFEPDIEIVGLAENGQEGVDIALQTEPDIVLMDINMPRMDGIQATSRIVSRLPNTAVIIMSVQNEADYLRRAMLAGAREYLSKPFGLDELIASIRHVNQLAQTNRRVAVDSAAHSAHPSGGRGKNAKIVTVFSLKGGVGRSTLAANLSVALRNQGDHEVVLMDGNLLYGDIGVMLNITDNRTIAEAVKNFDTMDRDLVSDILVTHSSGVKVLLAPANPQQGEQVTGEHVRQIFAHLTTMAEYIVIDTRPSFDEITLALLDRSDLIIVMLTLELTAIKAAKQYLELSDLLGYDSDRVLLVVNRSTAPAGITVEDVEASLKGSVVAQLPDDPALTLRAVNEGVPFFQSAPNQPLSLEIDRLAKLVRGEQQCNVADEANTLAVVPTASSGLRGRFARPTTRRKAS
ncbi:MAG: response regulator [Chloroflexota bacterium]|nr:response regulator [Chloroflexota bacterium]